MYCFEKNLLLKESIFEKNMLVSGVHYPMVKIKFRKMYYLKSILDFKFHNRLSPDCDVRGRRSLKSSFGNVFSKCKENLL